MNIQTKKNKKERRDETGCGGGGGGVRDVKTEPTPATGSPLWSPNLKAGSTDVNLG